MGEENNQKPSKKLIKVRKFRTNPNEDNQEESASTSNKDPNSIFSGGEEEIQVIEPGSHSGSSSKHPIEFMFPHLTQEGLDTNNLTKTMSTTDITKLLVGKKALIAARKRCKRRTAVDFTTILEEEIENSSSEDLKKTSKRKLPTLPAEMTDDGNESDISESEEESEAK